MVELPDFAAQRAPRVIAPGEPAELVLLRRDGERYRVERIIKYEASGTGR
jgi:hypothetical protein